MTNAIFPAEESNILTQRPNDIGQAETAITDARQELENLQAKLQRRIARRQPLLDQAAAADNERDSSEARRKELLLRVVEHQDPGEVAEFERLPSVIAAAAQRALDCREAAQQLEPAIAELAPQVHEARHRLSLAEYHLAWLQYKRRCEIQEAAIDGLRPTLEAWVRASQDFERAHENTFGSGSGLELAQDRITRTLAVKIREMVRQLFNNPFVGNRLGKVFPSESGSLTAALEPLRGDSHTSRSSGSVSTTEEPA